MLIILTKFIDGMLEPIFFKFKKTTHEMYPNDVHHFKLINIRCGGAKNNVFFI